MPIARKRRVRRGKLANEPTLPRLTRAPIAGPVVVSALNRGERRTSSRTEPSRAEPTNRRRRFRVSINSKRGAHRYHPLPATPIYTTRLRVYPAPFGHSLYSVHKIRVRAISRYDATRCATVRANTRRLRLRRETCSARRHAPRKIRPINTSGGER